MLLIGVDPGTSLTVAALRIAEGGVAGVEFADGERVSTRTKGVTGFVNQPALLVAELERLVGEARGNGAPTTVRAVVEASQLRGGQGLSSQSRYVGSEWLARGVLAAMRVPTTVVQPSVWKRTFGLKAAADKAMTKELSRLKALELVPEAAPHLTRKRDHNRAEALLLSLWGWKVAKAWTAEM